MPSAQGFSNDIERRGVRVLAGNDVLTVLERPDGASTKKARLVSTLTSVGEWAAAGDFYAAAVLICTARPSHLVIYSQWLLSEPDAPPAVVPDHWRVVPSSSVCASYETTLTRQSASTKERMQYLVPGQTVTIGTYGASALVDDERAISQRQLQGAGIRSVSFHQAVGAATGMEVVVWESPESLDLARGEGRPEFAFITGAGYQVHAVFTRDLDSRAGRG